MIKLPIWQLKLLTVLYLSLAYFIFFVGWLQPIYAVFSSVILGLAIYYFFRALDYSTCFILSYKELFLLVTITLLWVFLSGAGGFGYQVADYNKNNALTKDIIIQKWPVRYIVNNKMMFFSHYLGYYLPSPAVFGKLGWKITQLSIFCWTYLGVLISFLYFFRIIGKISIVLLLFLMLGNGIEIFSILYKNGIHTLDFLISSIKFHIPFFWVNGLDILPLTFQGNTSTLYWSPQHSLPAWIIIGMLLNDWKIDKTTLKYAPFYASLLVFWSPLVLIGVAPYLIYILFQTGFKPIFNIVNFVFAPIIFLLMASYVLAISGVNLYQHFILNYESPITHSMGLRILTFIYFLFIDVFVWCIPVWLVLKNDKEYKHLILLVLLMLSVIPLYRLGLWNDWCTRVSLPSLAILWVLVAKAFIKAGHYIRISLVFLLLLGSVEPLTFMLASIKQYLTTRAWTPPIEKNIGDVPSVCVGYPVEQFVASPNTFFFNYLAKK